ncbi:MAG: arginase family protein, partial [bacterium]|nr:arginase family protein [bacterium]
SLGMMAGLKSKKTGIIWFDSHGDFNTPQTSPSGYFDGMPLAVLTGHCSPRLLKTIGMREPLSVSLVLLVGLQSLDPKEKTALKKSRVGMISLKNIRQKGIKKCLLPKLKKLESKVSGIYLHFDIDVLAPKLAPGVDFRCRDGLSLKEARGAFRLIAKHFPVKGVSLTCYNPEKDKQNKTLKSAVLLIRQIVDNLK